MKKKILLALFTIVLLSSIVLTGCGGGVSQSEYDSLTALLADAQSKLTAAQNNYDALLSDKSAVDADLLAAQAQVIDLQQQVTDLQAQVTGFQQQVTDLQQQVDDLVAQYEFTGMSTADMAAKIVENYEATHLYEKDVYDCNNMASDLWNMLKAQGIDAVIVIGSITASISNILQSDHAWVLADVGPGELLALDATIGQAISDTTSLYYRGWSFANPAELKRNDDLRTQYNARVGFINAIIAERNAVMLLYNASTTPAEADKWMAVYNRLGDLRDAQEALLSIELVQINELATPL